MEFSQVDDKGIVVRARYTTNKDAAVPAGHRLLQDQMPEWDLATEECVRVEPVSKEATAIQYVVRPMSYTDDQLAQDARFKRDSALAACDRTQLLDSGLSEDARCQWAEYRQLLRDVPQQSGFPRQIVWPERP
jgi:hypothetical protein